MRFFLLLSALLFSTFAYATATITIKANPGIDLKFVSGCVTNVQTWKENCVTASTEPVFDDDGQPVLDAQGSQVVRSTGVFTLDMQAGKYFPYLKTNYGTTSAAKNVRTYLSQRATNLVTYFVKDLQKISFSIFADKKVTVSSVCDNLNGTVTIKGSGFGMYRNYVTTSGYESNLATFLPVWTDTYIVVVTQPGVPVYPVTVTSKNDGSAYQYIGTYPIPTCF